MRKDPRKACANEEQCLGWAVLHDLVAHPLMVLTGWSRGSLAFHDWTSRHAWPREQLAAIQPARDALRFFVLIRGRGQPVPYYVRQTEMRHFYVIDFTHRDHSLVVRAEALHEVILQVEDYLERLETP